MGHHALSSRAARWWLPGSITLAAAASQTADRVDGLRLERALALAEPWRLATGHLVHPAWTHLLLNIAGLAVLWVIVGDAIRPGAWLCVILACAAAVSLGLLVFSPAVAWYVGMSGILHGMLAAGAIASLGQRPALGAILLALLTGKLVLEWLATGESATSSLVGGAVITDAHLYGALAGLACGAVLRALPASRA